MDAETFRREQRNEQGQAKGLRDLVALGMRRGMKNPSAWAANVSAARTGRRAGAADYKAARDAMKELQA